MPPDKALITRWMTRASSGDDEAFGQLAEAVQDEVFRFALAHGLRHADAVEATQEVLLRAYRRRRHWRSDGNAIGWLFGIAMNVVREHRRHRAKAPTTGLEPAVMDDLQACARPEQEGAETLGRLARALDELPPRQREAVTCRYLRQMNVRDTGVAMGCAEGTVKATVAAAMANLRRILGRQE